MSDTIPIVFTLEDLIAKLGAEELEVLRRVAVRLEMGQRHYGKLNLAKDERNFRFERHEELLDALVYSAIADEALERKRVKS